MESPLGETLSVGGLVTALTNLTVNGRVMAAGGLVLRRDPDAILHVAVEDPGTDLRVGENEETGSVIIGNPRDPDNLVEVHPPLVVGTQDNAGNIDANGAVGGLGQPLHIGTGNTTRNVVGWFDAAGVHVQPVGPI